jgi:hypothetical protein
VITGNDYLQYELPSWHVRRLVRRVRRWVQIDVGHQEMLRPPAVDELARAVQSALVRMDPVRER